MCIEQRVSAGFGVGAPSSQLPFSAPMWPAGYEDPLKLCLTRRLVGGQALKVNNGGQAKLKSIRISPDLRYILWEPSKKGTNAKFGAFP